MWTVQMFLMFTLNRPDIFPVTDLALQKGYSAFYKKNGYNRFEISNQIAIKTPKGLHILIDFCGIFLRYYLMTFSY